MDGAGAMSDTNTFITLYANADLAAERPDKGGKLHLYPTGDPTVAVVVDPALVPTLMARLQAAIDGPPTKGGLTLVSR